jgi:hypothetical protein
MRAIIIFLMSCSLVNFISAQENKDLVYDDKQDDIQTLFGNHSIVHGGYGAITFAYSEIDHFNAASIGGRGAWIIGHWFAIGIGGTGFINDINYNTAEDQYTNLTGGYGGLLLEPIIIPTFPVHISLPVLAGAGGIAYVTSHGIAEVYEPPTYVEDATSFFIVEPGAELELNFLKHIRIALGITYRFTSEIILNDVPGVSPPIDHYPLNGWTGTVALKFGRF